MEESLILELAEEHGTPLFIIDHNQIRQNYKIFRENLPRVQVYYAIKANSDLEIIKTLFNQGSSFDVASLNEFMKVYKLIEGWDNEKKSNFIWHKIIYANTIKLTSTLEKLKQYKPLITFDNEAELEKIKKYCNTAGLVCRVKVPNTGSIVEFGSKFGIDPSSAVDLIEKAFQQGLDVEGISFHVGSQCLNSNNYVDALNITSSILEEIKKLGHKLKLIDIGGGFPAHYDENVPDFKKFSEIINSEIKRLFEEDLEIIAEPGRFMVANSAFLVTKIIGKARREGKIFYYIDDGVYGTFSGVVYDHCQYHFSPLTKTQGEKEICAVVGPTCDGFDKISMSEELPNDLEIGDYLLTKNIGAYSIVSATDFNGLERAKIIHINL
jgi:ornithine decarboxylase